MKYHFIPEKGWINDPNGTIKINDTYHLFYQHYPHDIIWGPMHWGHAITKDFIHYEHLPIALYPNENEYIFSGSCVLDTENVSNLGTKEKPALIAMYTSHHPTTNEEQQSIAYSLDYVHFTKYDKNPIIKNKIDDKNFKKDFRDPKIFKNPIKGGYTCAIAAGLNIEFYHSFNLLDWNYTGTFNPQLNGFKGICECPDCFPLVCDGKEKWILIISAVVDEKNIPDSYQNKHVMEYFVGDFNGDTFIDTELNNKPLQLDYGPDNYAMVSFADASPITLIGWGVHWRYARYTPVDTYRGLMTLPRFVELKETIKGYRLVFSTIDVPFKKYIIKEGNTLILRNDLNEHLDITVLKDEIIVDRSHFKGNEFSERMEDKGLLIFKAERYTTGDLEVNIHQDDDFFEIFTENGLVVFSIRTFQSSDNHQLENRNNK